MNGRTGNKQKASIKPLHLLTHCSAVDVVGLVSWMLCSVFVVHFVFLIACLCSFCSFCVYNTHSTLCSGFEETARKTRKIHPERKRFTLTR